MIIFGTTAGGEEISVVRGDILLDASFNIGGDTVVLPGAAGSYTTTLSGSFVTIAGGDISIAIPVGVAGLTVEFADAERMLRFDTVSGQVMLGDQAIGTVSEAVEPATTPFVGDGLDSGPASMARLLLTVPGQDIDIGGNVTIFGTSGGGEVITVLDGTVLLDASFNIGGDTVVLPGALGSYTATLSGSFVTIAGGGLSVAIPVGVAGLSLEFSDTVETLRFDTVSSTVMLGDQVVTSSGILAAAQLHSSKPVAEPEADNAAYAQLSSIALHPEFFAFG